jgi:hypothetical protein
MAVLLLVLAVTSPLYIVRSLFVNNSISRTKRRKKERKTLPFIVACSDAIVAASLSFSSDAYGG